MYRILLNAVLLFVLLNGCAIFTIPGSSDEQVKFSDDLKNKRVAVLDFEIRGANMPGDLEEYMADELTLLLASDTNLTVVDRIIVRSLSDQLKDEIVEKYISDKFVRKMGAGLDVDYIILGSLWQNNHTSLLLDKSEKNLKLSVRFLKIPTLELSGFVKINRQYTTYTNEIVDESLSYIAKRISEQ